MDRIAGGANAASKAPGRFPANYPKQIERGEGAYVFDPNGNRYLDFCCSLGPIILGYCFDCVDDVVCQAIKTRGNIFSLQNTQERVLADLLADLIPTAEMSRFTHNGVDATSAAVRLARHITGRDLVLSFSYHGSADVFMASGKVANGVPECLKKTILEFDYNDHDWLKELFEKAEVAAVIMEPHTIRLPENNFLELVRDLCDHYGALLIFDEVVTFPRYPGLSAQKYFGVYPDLTCISKAMANGYPISALVGLEKYMKELKDGGVFVSTTFGGNLIGVTAAIEALKFIYDKNVPEYLWGLGEVFCAEIKPNKYLKTKGLPMRQFFDCSDEVRIKVWQEMIKRGYFFHVPIFFNYSMTRAEMVEASQNINQVIDNLDNIQIEGEMPSEVFKKV